MEAQEVELKFEMTDEALTRLAKHPAFAAPAQTSRLRSVYFDNPDRDLKNASFGLRVRHSENGRVQTLKWEKPAAPLLRREWETGLTGERPDLAALAETPAAEVLNGGDEVLEPVFTTTVERDRRLWVHGEDVVELSLDRGEITSGARHEPICELELELKAGDPQALFELAAALSKRACLPLLFRSKAERGFHLADDPGWAPERAPPTALTPETPAGDAFREVAHGCLAQVAKNAAVLRQHRSLEALHQMRVGLRRLRAALTTFRALGDGPEFAHLKQETRWLAGELDAARDLDVFILDGFRTAKPPAQDRDAFASLGAQLLHAQSRAYEQACAAMTSPRFHKLMLAAFRWLEVGDWLRSDEPTLRSLRDTPVEIFARDRLDRMHRQVRKRGRNLAKLDQASRHRLRVKAKKLRYAAEFFSGCFGHAKRRERLLAVLGELQDHLGQLNDVAVSHRLVLDQVRGHSAEAGFAAGLIVAGREAAADRARPAAVKAFAEFDALVAFWA
jgi:inorganic triphosphatase YgiF